MTTSIRVDVAKNLFVKNEVMNLNKASFGTDSLAGASWVIQGVSAHTSLRLGLDAVFALINNKLPHLELWLLAGTSAWQPDTSIVRHNKLWNALRARGFNVPSGSRSMKEMVIESAGKLKIFGAAKLAEFAIEDVVNILLGENCTYLVALPVDGACNDLLNIGWSGDLSADSKFIEYLFESDALLLKHVGQFDDYERGVVVIGCPLVVSALLT